MPLYKRLDLRAILILETDLGIAINMIERCMGREIEGGVTRF